MARQDDFRVVSPTIGSAPNRPRLISGTGFGDLTPDLDRFNAAVQGFSDEGQGIRLEEARLQEAKRQEALGYKRATAAVELTRMDGKFARAQIDFINNITDSELNGLPEVTEGRARQQFEGWLKGLPKELQKEYAPQVEALIQGYKSSSFDTQVLARKSELLQSITLIQETAINELMRGDGDPEAIVEKHLGAIDELLKAAPLMETEQNKLYEEHSQAIRLAQIAREAREEALGKVTNGGQAGTVKFSGGAYKADGPVAAGMAPEMRGLLTAIYGGESGNVYNKMYGGQHFSAGPNDEDWQHPNVATPIKDGPNVGQTSSAAGAPQFLYSTWKGLQERYGFEDFSPENQDWAAWKLAEELWHKNHPNSDLLSVLRTGDYGLISQVYETLKASNGGWEIFDRGSISKEEFYRQVTSANPSASSLLYDEQYAGIPFDLKAAALQSAASEAVAFQTAELSRQKAALAALDQQIRDGLSDGSMSWMEARVAGAHLGGEAQREHEEIYKKYNEEQYQAGQALAGFANGKTWDPTKKEDKDQLGSFYKAIDTQSIFDNQDWNRFSTEILPSVAESNYIPEYLADLMITATNSGNAAEAAFAYEALDALSQDRLGNAFEKAFDDQLQIDVIDFRNLKQVMPLESALEAVRPGISSGAQAIQAQNKKIANENLADNPNMFVPKQIASSLGFKDAPIDPTQETMMQEQFATYYRYSFTKTGNHRQAYNAATEMMKRQWGGVKINGKKQLMWIGPDKTAPAWNGGWQWVDPQFQEFGGPRMDKTWTISTDNLSLEEYQAGEKVSYPVRAHDEFGFPRFVTWKETQWWEDNMANIGPRMANAIGNQFARFTPEITAAMQEEEALRREARADEQRVLNNLKAEWQTATPERQGEIDTLIENLIPSEATKPVPVGEWFPEEQAQGFEALAEQYPQHAEAFAEFDSLMRAGKNKRQTKQMVIDVVNFSQMSPDMRQQILEILEQY